MGGGGGVKKPVIMTGDKYSNSFQNEILLIVWDAFIKTHTDMFV